MGDKKRTMKSLETRRWPWEDNRRMSEQKSINERKERLKWWKRISMRPLKTRLNNSDSQALYSHATRNTTQQVRELRRPNHERLFQPRPDCMEALAQIHSAMVMYQCDMLKLQVSKKISGCHGPNFGHHSVSYHSKVSIVMGGYALPTCPETGPTL